MRNRYPPLEMERAVLHVTSAIDDGIKPTLLNWNPFYLGTITD